MSKKKKIILAVIGAILVVAVSSLITVLILNLTGKKTDTNEPKVSTAALREVASPDTILKEYTDSTSIGERATAYTKVETNTSAVLPKGGSSDKNSPVTIYAPTNTTITYKTDTYETVISASGFVQYTQNDKTASKNVASIDTATVKFLEDQGFIKKPTTSTVNGIAVTSFDSKNVICETTNYDTVVLRVAAYGLACVQKQAVIDKVTFIDTLYALSKSDKKEELTSVLLGNTITEGNKQLASLTVAYSEPADAGVLLFGAIDGTWEYIGERSIPFVDNADSFKLSDELKSAIANPKWGDFLKNNIR